MGRSGLCRLYPQPGITVQSGYEWGREPKLQTLDDLKELLPGGFGRVRGRSRLLYGLVAALDIGRAHQPMVNMALPGRVVSGCSELLLDEELRN